MAAITRLINPRCPCCGKKALESYRSKPEESGAVSPNSGARSWLWTACVACGKNFKEQHFGDGRLYEVPGDEWVENVIAA